MALKRAVGFVEGVGEGEVGESSRWERRRLAAEAVQSAALALERVDDVHGGDGLALGVLAVGDGIANHVLEEHLTTKLCLG